MPHLAAWQWMLGGFSAFMIGVAKTGAPGIGTLVAPLMVILVGDARHAPAWALPVLLTADVFAVWYWRKHAEARQLFALAPWVVAGIVGGAVALGLEEAIIRRMLGGIVFGMLAIYLYRRFSSASEVHGSPALYGLATGFSSTVANAAGPVMSLYLLSKNLPKEQFVATGTWFFLVLNLAKVPVYVYHTLFSAESLTFDVMMIPLVLCGAFAGRWLVRVMPQKVFETAVIAMTGVSCLLLFR